MDRGGAAANVADGGSARIEGLDVWRSALMLGGLLVHGAATLGQDALFTAIDIVSQAFRMGTFFALSGFLTAFALARHRDRPWLARRLRRLGIPAVAGMLLLSPIVWLLHVAHGTPIAAMPLPFEWHHLWFLWGLMLCSAAAVAVDRADRRYGLLARIGAKATPTLALLATALCTEALFLIVPPVLGRSVPDWLFRPLANTQLIGGYLPTFLFGFLLARAPGLLGATLARWPLAAAIVILTVLADLAVVGGALAAWEKEVRVFGAALCPPAAFVLVLRSALAIRRVPRAVRDLSDASYTIYLLHLPIALAINVAMAPLGLHAYAQFAMAVLGAGTMSWAFHVVVVRTTPVVALLLNGERRDAPAPSVDEARDDVAVAAADLHARAGA